jgi:hypothetical protein
MPSFSTVDGPAAASVDEHRQSTRSGLPDLDFMSARSLRFVASRLRRARDGDRE